MLLSVRGGRALGLPLLFQKDRDLLRGLLHPALEPLLGPAIEAVGHKGRGVGEDVRKFRFGSHAGQQRLFEQMQQLPPLEEAKPDFSINPDDCSSFKYWDIVGALIFKSCMRAAWVICFR